MLDLMIVIDLQLVHANLISIQFVHGSGSILFVSEIDKRVVEGCGRTCHLYLCWPDVHGLDLYASNRSIP
jgi:hypothetical protein